MLPLCAELYMLAVCCCSAQNHTVCCCFVQYHTYIAVCCCSMQYHTFLQWAAALLRFTQFDSRLLLCSVSYQYYVSVITLLSPYYYFCSTLFSTTAQLSVTLLHCLPALIQYSIPTVHGCFAPDSTSCIELLLSSLLVFSLLL